MTGDSTRGARDGDEVIFVINADGTGERHPTGDSENDDDPDFRPGG